MKFILASLLSLLLSVAPVLAASSPTGSISLTKDKRYVDIKFSGLKNVSRVDYVLTYDTTGGQKGFEGGVKLKNKSTSFSRRQILGTCSSKKCVYHSGIKNVTLEATLTLRSGGTTTITKSL